MLKAFKSKERLINFLNKRYPNKTSSIKVLSTPSGFFILKEGLTLTDALARLFSPSTKSPWKEEEYIHSITKRS